VPAGTNAPQTAPALRHTRLAEHARLRVDARSCLPQRFAGLKCSACVDACPVGVLSLRDDGWELAAGCTGCGRCAAACPTSALVMDGFSVDLAIEGPVTVDCQRVPAADSPPGAIRVPCLGGLKTSQMLRLANHGGADFLDRGWCRDCPSAGPELPWAERMADANLLLESVDTPAEQRLTTCLEPLPVRRRLPGSSDPANQQPVSRRAFFTRIAGQAADALSGSAADPDVADVDAPRPDGRERIHPSERVATLAELARMSRRTGHPLPARLFPSVRIGPGCQNHAVCARACPTAALHLVASGDETGVVFDASLCIACGECGRICPEAALEFNASGTGLVPGQQLQLTRHRNRICFDCGFRFAEPIGDARRSEAETLCPGCRKSRQLTRSLFSSLFQSHAGQDHHP
jgi:ferredoxin